MAPPSPAAVPRSETEAALVAADIPVLLMVLVHLTGERRWLEAPYRPKRDISFFPDESGGLAEELQAEVKAAALDALEAFHQGRLALPLEPDDALYLHMMSVMVGEPVPPEYLTMMLEEMGLRQRFPAPLPAAGAPDPAEFRVLIVGAGMSGLLTAYQLDRAGIPWTLVEKNPWLGGTWYENVYPDVRCDVPNHFYSYSFRPNPDWTGYYSRGPEIEAYFERFARDAGLLDRIRFSTGAREAEWDDRAALWRVRLVDGNGRETVEQANVLVCAVGQLNVPKYPDIPGQDSFRGRIFHTARWPRDVDTAGQRVAMIGTGASGMQVARPTAETAARLTIFQRSKQWAIPSRDYHRTVSPQKQWLLRHVPYYAGWYRFSVAWRFSDQLLATVRRDPAWEHPDRSMNARNDRHRQNLTNYVLEQLDDRPDLIAKVLPDYPPYGKRILVDNHWYRTLKRDNVELVTEPVARIVPDGVETASGAVHAADVIVLATGFQATRYLGSMQVRGRDGRSLREVWGEDDARAYLGMTVPGFPNLFCLYGPNTNLGHGGSIIFVAECQVRYLVASVLAMRRHHLAALEVRQAVYDDYVARVDAEHEQMIWTHPGMDTWYRNRAGRVVSLMPWRLADYWRFTRAPDLDDYAARPVSAS